MKKEREEELKKEKQKVRQKQRETDRKLTKSLKFVSCPQIGLVASNRVLAVLTRNF